MHFYYLHLLGGVLGKPEPFCKNFSCLGSQSILELVLPMGELLPMSTFFPLSFKE